jgi:uncharacterized membrane protein YeiH
VDDGPRINLVNGFVGAVTPSTVHALPIWIDVCAMSINAAFGAAVARNRQLALLAVLVAGVIVGLGGGIVRDVLLGLEASAVQSWYYIPAVLAAALIGGFLAHRITKRHIPYLLIRGVAVGLLVTIGVQKGIAYKTPGDAAIFIGVICGTMGGALGDVMAAERLAIFREAHWELGSVIVAATIFWLLSIYVNFWLATAAAIVTVSSLTMLSVKLGWNRASFPGDRVPT